MSTAVDDDGVIHVDAANRRATVPDVLTDQYGRNPIRVTYTVEHSPDGSTQVFIDVDADQAGVGSFNGDQVFGISDRWGNPRATLLLHTFDGLPGESVDITVVVDSYPAASITVHAAPDVPMAYPLAKGDARQFVHLPSKDAVRS